MGNYKRSLAFNIEITALRNAFAIDYTSKLNIMSKFHNCGSIIDIELHQHRSTTCMQLKSKINMTFISYYNINGTTVVNCIKPRTGKIRTIKDSPTLEFCFVGIYFSKVKHMIDVDNTHKIAMNLFLRLLVSDHAVINKDGINRRINTFNGPNDWDKIVIDTYKILIYDLTEAVQHPFHLNSSNFANPTAIIDVESKVNNINETLTDVMYQIFLDKMYGINCPNSINNPAATINKVKQSIVLQNVAKHH